MPMLDCNTASREGSTHAPHVAEEPSGRGPCPAGHVSAQTQERLWSGRATAGPGGGGRDNSTVPQVTLLPVKTSALPSDSCSSNGDFYFWRGPMASLTLLSREDAGFGLYSSPLPLPGTQWDESPAGWGDAISLLLIKGHSPACYRLVRYYRKSSPHSEPVLSTGFTKTNSVSEENLPPNQTVSQSKVS